MSATLERGAAGYTKLVRALIDHCFVSRSSAQHYDSVFDVKDIITLEQYRINQLY